MFFWIYDMPAWQLALFFGAFFVGTTWLGIIFISPFLKLWLKGQEGINDLVGYALSCFGVFYGLMLGLLSVATYQNSSEVGSTVSKEAASLAALYRDVSSYPEPIRTEMTGRLRTYTEFVIKKAWPSQRKGEIHPAGVQMMDDFQQVLTKFEPTTKGQELLHGEALHQYNQMILLRRERIHSISTGIPGAMWYVVGVGALINTLLILCFRMRLDIHLVLGGALSFFVGVLIFMVAAMDYPFRGEVSIGPEAFELIYSGLMSR